MTPIAGGGAIRIVGLGPAGFDRISIGTAEMLLDPDVSVVLRTGRHPASVTLAERREVVTCDDLYEEHDEFDRVYQAIVQRVLSVQGPVVYAVPGSPVVGERTVAMLRDEAEVEIFGAESFLDLAYAAAGFDPLVEGVRVLDARDLPFPLLLEGPIIIGQVDHPLVAGDLKVRLLDQLPPDLEIMVLTDLGADAERIDEIPLEELDRIEVGIRTSVALRVEGVGWPGLVQVVERLRTECPWDSEQTHQSLVRYLVEESYEVIEAIGRLPVDATQALDPVDYVELEDELGDVLLQVLLHATIASESAGFTIDDIAEQQRAKLVRRHPHVFGDVKAESAAEVESNWAERKATERGTVSIMDGVPAMPPLAKAEKVQRRAAKAGFDWPDPAPVYDKIREETDEVAAADPADQKVEIGDLLFSVVNLARHLGVDPELALTASVDKFIGRFRAMEEMGPMDGLSLAEMDERWESVKRGT